MWQLCIALMLMSLHIVITSYYNSNTASQNKMFFCFQHFHTGIDICTEDLQLLLYGCFYLGISNEAGSLRTSPIFQRQVRNTFVKHPM